MKKEKYTSITLQLNDVEIELIAQLISGGIIGCEIEGQDATRLRHNLLWLRRCMQPETLARHMEEYQRMKISLSDPSKKCLTNEALIKYSDEIKQINKI